MENNTVTPQEGELALLKRYFQTLHGTTDPIRIHAFHELDKKIKAKADSGPLETMLRQAAKWNKEGFGIYNPIQEILEGKKRNDKNVSAVNTLFMDFDQTPVGPALKILDLR